MANLLLPSNSVIGTPEPVNLDTVNSITKGYYIDRNDKLLNRYTIVFTSDGGVVTWSYDNGEDRNADYNKAIAQSAGGNLPFTPETKTSDFTVGNFNKLYLVDCSAGDVVVYFDPSLYDSGREWFFKKITIEGRIIFTPLSGTIDDEATQISTYYNTNTAVAFDGTNFKLV